MGLPKIASNYWVEQHKRREPQGWFTPALTSTPSVSGIIWWLWAGSAQFRGRFKEVLDRTRWTERLAIQYDTPKAESDHQHFYTAGIP